MSESLTCSCSPGSHSDGWQEVRSAGCLAREMDAWRHMLARYAALDPSP